MKFSRSSILYETDADLVISNSNDKTKTNTKHTDKNTDSSSRKKKKFSLPKLKPRLAIVGFNNINFTPFTNEEEMGDTVGDGFGGYNSHGDDGIDLVMEECPIDDDREPIIAHMV